MKKLFFNLLFLFWLFPALVCAQGGVVSAPVLESLTSTNKATLIKQLAEGMKQTSVLTDTYKQLKKSVELYYEISAALQQIDMITNVIDRQIDLVNTCAAALRDIQKVKGATTASVQRVRRNIQTIIDGYQENLNLVTKILTKDALRMDDGARIELLMKVNEKTEKAMRDVSSHQSAFEAATNAQNMLKQL
jgi:uncharacterized protein YerC